MSKITKSWKTLTEAQMLGWDHLAEHTSGQSVFGQAAQISGLNLYIRLNVSRTMAGESILSDAPEQLVCLPNVAYTALWITPKNIVIKGITHESGYKLVVKMSAGQSAGVSNAWSKTVILSPGMEDDWGDADMTYLYFKTIGVKPAVGEKVFLEMYWLDPETGFVGQSAFTFKLKTVPADVTNLKLVIEATEGQSNGVSRAYSKAAQIKLVSSPSTTAVDIKSDYEAKNGVLGAGAPKVFFRYYFVNSVTGEKSGIMLADAIWAAGE